MTTQESGVMLTQFLGMFNKLANDEVVLRDIARTYTQSMLIEHNITKYINSIGERYHIYTDEIKIKTPKFNILKDGTILQLEWFVYSNNNDTLMKVALRANRNNGLVTPKITAFAKLESQQLWIS